ncbi:MAG TPA: hypothetical protein ENJ28_03620, partial [Gammaproteobacteria bacterium]|nr:hypothetical protein [Gammaproteobacteria bacterium]
MFKHRNMIVVTICILVLFFALVFRLVFLTLGEENRLRTDFRLMNRSPVSLELLNTHVTKLEEMTNNIENVAFGDIQNAIKKTIILVNQSNLELKAQYESWSEIQSKIKKDSISFRNLKETLVELEGAENERIIKLKELFDKSEQPSTFDNIKN